ncbi:MAG TPA: hypothetical protein VKQ08_06200, partial [Cyclobacteriaceae bacterium]|nr:hypothetical protein [Cyclobacteriaceae bacterium]
LGENNSYQASEKYPMEVLAKDFDGNGSIDPILACYMITSMQDHSRKLFPVHFWDELNSQSPMFRRKFKRFKEYGKVSVSELLSPADMKGVLALQANNLKTSYFENLGKNKFRVKPLPLPVQVAPINGMAVGDFNQDENLDVAMVGNNFSNEVFVGRYDAFTGLVLLGNGKGEFDVIQSCESNFYIPNDAKGLASFFIRGQQGLIATQNRDSLKCFLANLNPNAYSLDAGPLDSYAVVDFGGGKKQKIEFCYGSGYLSQSSRKVLIGHTARKARIFDFKGRSRELSFGGEKKLP